MPKTSKKTSRGGGSTRGGKRNRRLVTPDDLTAIQIPQDAQISPDARTVVFVLKRVDEERNEFVRSLWTVAADGTAPARAFTSGRKDHHPRWSPDGRSIAFISEREKGRPQIHVISADGGEARALTDFPEGDLGGFRWAPTGRTIVASFRERAADRTREAKEKREERGLSEPPKVIDDPWYRLDGDGYFVEERFALHLVDATSGAHEKIVSKDKLGQYSYDISPDGHLVAYTANTHKRAVLTPSATRLFVYDVRTGKSRELEGAPAGPKTALAWSPDGTRLAYAGREGSDDLYSVENLHAWVLDVKAKRAYCLTDREDYCLLASTLTDASEVVFEPGLRWSPDGKRVLLELGWHGEQHVASVPARGGRITFHTEGAVYHTLGSLSSDGRRAALVVTSATRPAEIHACEIPRGAKAAWTTKALTSTNAAFVSEHEIAKPRSHWVDSTDGTRVQVWVLRPPRSVRRKRGPAVLNIHGGPHAQYGVPFFHEMQVLAAAGYTVFYSNPRGSKGYGRDHTAAIRGSWGGADWDDIQAVTEFMKGYDGVDERRLGIMGGSYGGYMTNWAIGHSDDYAGAITDRCVSNMVSMWGSSDVYEVPGLYWRGAAWDDASDLWEQSPIRYFKNVRTPTLIIHSEGDLRCNIEQAEQVYSALTHLRVPTRFVRYPKSTSHGMSRSGPPDLRIHRLEQILDWWKRHLK